MTMWIICLLIGLAVAGFAAPAVIDQRRLPLASSGALAAAVDGPARRSGLRSGDQVLAVNGREVGDVEALKAALRRSGIVVLQVERKGWRGDILIDG